MVLTLRPSSARLIFAGFNLPVAHSSKRRKFQQITFLPICFPGSSSCMAFGNKSIDCRLYFWRLAEAFAQRLFPKVIDLGTEAYRLQTKSSTWALEDIGNFLLPPKVLPWKATVKTFRLLPTGRHSTAMDCLF
jgi:hypothetical protein